MANKLKKASAAGQESQSNRPNVVFVGHRQGRSPFRFVAFPDGVVELPEHTDKPFYFERAAELIKLFGNYYKEVMR